MSKNALPPKVNAALDARRWARLKLLFAIVAGIAAAGTLYSGNQTLAFGLAGFSCFAGMGARREMLNSRNRA